MFLFLFFCRFVGRKWFSFESYGKISRLLEPFNFNNVPFRYFHLSLVLMFRHFLTCGLHYLWIRKSLLPIRARNYCNSLNVLGIRNGPLVSVLDSASGGQVGVLARAQHCVFGQNTLFEVPLFTKEYKWVPANVTMS